MKAITNPKLNHLLHDFRQGLSELYGDRLVNLILFGSHARQDSTPESDVDIMVILKGKVSPGDEIFRMGAIKAALNIRYDELISVIPISETDYRNRHTPLLKAIHQEGISV